MESSKEQGAMGVAEIIETRMALQCLDESSLSGFVNNNVENLLATLQEAMEFEDVECRILVSNMVGEAIMRGLVRAVSEEASEQLSAKDLEITRERNLTRDKEVAIAELEMALRAKEAELAAHIEDADAHARSRALAFAQELEQTFQRWQCSESTALEKEAESAKIAGHLIEMASLLKNETQNGAALESRLQQLFELDSAKAAQIASLQEREEQLRMEARFNELMLNEIMKSFREEVQKVLEEKEKENDELKILLKERDKLKETESSVTDLKEQVAEQKFMQEVESEIIKVCFEGAMLNTFKEVDAVGKSSIKQGKSENSHKLWKSEYAIDSSAQDFKQKFQSLEDGDMIAAGVKKDCTQLKHCTNCKAQLEEQQFRFEVEIDLISSYWLSVTDFMQQELRDLHRDLNRLQAKLSTAETELSESRQCALNFKTESQSINQAYEHTVTEIDLLEGKLEVLETESKEMFNSKDGEIILLTNYREELIWRHEVESQLVAENLDCWRTELAKVLAMKDEEILCLSLEINKLKQKQVSFSVSQREEMLPEQQLSLDSELLVSSTILHQKQQEISENEPILNSIINRKERGLESIQEMTVERAEEMEACKKNLELLAHELKKLDMQLCSVSSHMVQTECTSSSCCDCDISDIKFDAALQRLQSQVKTIESRVVWMMEQSEHQEWRHNVEVEIALFICTDAFEESKRKLEANQNVGTSKVVFHDEIPNTELLQTRDMVEPPVGNTAQLISSLKSEIADLKREKEQIVCDKTEEIYKLKRAFWKEKEKWISGSYLSNDRDTSNPSKWPAKSTISSGDYIERVGSIDSDILASAFREEWQIEKAGDLEKIAQLENEVKALQEKLACMEELEKEKIGLLQRTSELENNVKELTQKLVEFNVASEWESEKASFLEKITQLEKNAEVLEKNLASAEELGREKVGLLQRTSELENNVKELTQKLAELNKKGSDIITSAFREEWEIEKASYLEKTTQLEKDAAVLEKKLAFVEELERENAGLLQRTSESESNVKELTHKLVEFSNKEDEHATRESQLLAHIDQLENERNRLLAEQKNSDSVRELLEREISDGVLEKKLASVEELEREKVIFLERTSELESNVKELSKTLVELSQKEDSCATRESQLLDRINQLENERNRLLEERKNSDSVRDILEREVSDGVLEEKLASVEELEREKVGLLQRTSELESNVKELMHKLVELSRKEDGHATRESQLLSHINQLENERMRGILEREKYDLMTRRSCTENELKEVGEKYTALVESGRANAVTEFKPSTCIGELENPIMYANEINTLHDYTSSLELEKQHLLLLISEKDKEIQIVKGNITELVEKEKRHSMTESGLLNRIKDLEKEMQQLVEEHSNKSLLTSLLAQKDCALALAVKDKEEEGRLRRSLEEQLQQSKLETDTLSSQIGKVMELRSGLNSIQEQLRTCLTGGLNDSLHAFGRFENDTKALIQDKIVRLEHLRTQYSSLKEQFNAFASREYLYNKKLLREVNNLQKAEAEVDLLGDEVDALLDLLGKAVETLDIYYPVLKNYPQIAELRKLLKHELHLRTESLLGC